jgi:hypothetical protein
LHDIANETSGIDTAYLNQERERVRDKHIHELNQRDALQQITHRAGSFSAPPSATHADEKEPALLDMDDLAREVLDEKYTPPLPPPRPSTEQPHVALDDLASAHLATKREISASRAGLAEPQPVRGTSTIRRKSLTPVTVDVDSQAANESIIAHTDRNSAGSLVSKTPPVPSAVLPHPAGGTNKSAGNIFNPMFVSDMPGGSRGLLKHASTFRFDPATPALEAEQNYSAAIPLKIRDLRRLDFSVNPSIEFSIQVGETSDKRMFGKTLISMQLLESTALCPHSRGSYPCGGNRL